MPVKSSILRELTKEEMRQRQELESRLDAERSEGLSRILEWRWREVEKLEKERWVDEYFYWMAKLEEREAKLLEGHKLFSSDDGMRIRITKFLEEHEMSSGSLHALDKDALISLVKKIVAFCELTLDESLRVYAHYLV